MLYASLDFWVCFVKYSSPFQLTARVFDVNTQQETDDLLPIHIIVDDVNDNPPTFTGPQLYTVLEQSKAGASTLLLIPEICSDDKVHDCA